MKDNAEVILDLLKAFKFAAHKHQHQRRKNETAVPYINHLIAVADILCEIGEVRDIDIIVAGILHDTIEDTDTSPDELEAEFYAAVSVVQRRPYSFAADHTGYRPCRLRRFTAVLYYRIESDIVVVMGLFVGGRDESRLRDRGEP